MNVKTFDTAEIRRIMITSFKIENFKGFCELELPLSRITLLGGSNNVGKTSVLEALFTFFSRYDPQILTRLLMQRGVSVLPPLPEMMWAPIFHNFDMTQPIFIYVTVNGKQESLEIEYDPTYAPQTISIQSTSNGGGSAIQSDTAMFLAATLNIRHRVEDKEDQLMRVSLGAGQLHISYDPPNFNFPPDSVAYFGPRIPLNTGDLAERFGRLDIVGKQGRIAEFLRLVEPRLVSLSVIPTGNIPLIYGDIGLPRKIPLAYMGEGMTRMLDYIVNMATKENGLMLIDEVAEGIHHSILPKVWQAIAGAAREFNCQIIATTHSYECLRAALEGMEGEYASDLTYIRLDRRENCVRPVRFDYELLETASEMRLEVR